MCCSNIFSDRSILELKACPYCEAESPMIEEVDKEDRVIFNGSGFSGDEIFEKRPWGSFNVIMDKEFVKIKELIINPKSKISLQLHRKREEFWVVLKGKGILTLGLDEIPVEEGQPIHIRKYEMHSINNYTDEDLVIIEIQKGVCKEDDIIRIEDDYGRLQKETFSETNDKNSAYSGNSNCCSKRGNKKDKKDKKTEEGK